MNFKSSSQKDIERLELIFCNKHNMKFDSDSIRVSGKPIKGFSKERLTSHSIKSFIKNLANIICSPSKKETK